jgi:hypothetical protein
MATEKVDRNHKLKDTTNFKLNYYDGSTNHLNINTEKKHNEHIETNETNRFFVSFKVAVKAADVAFQYFNISAWVKVDHHLSNKRNDLKFSIDVWGPMLSDNWPSLRKLGSGYFPDAVEIRFTPIKDESMPNEPLYNVEDGPWPFNNDTVISATKEWERIVTNGGDITGLCWKYQCTSDFLQKNLNHRSFAPGKHSCHWITLEAMSRFRITITQVLKVLSRKITGW